MFADENMFLVMRALKSVCEGAKNIFISKNTICITIVILKK